MDWSKSGPGVKILLNFQSAQNVTKTVPLRLSRLPDSGDIFTFSNGLSMEKLSWSVRRAKQAKIWCWLYLSVQSVQSIQDTWQVHTGHVAGPYRTCGGSRWWHVSGSFGFLGVRLDQFGGDTCHHWKGDTWHRVTSASCVSDDVSSMRGADMVEVMWQVMWHSFIGWQFDEWWCDTWHVFGIW
jgi:hypothetical protein